MAYSKEYYQQLLAQGLCGVCGKNPRSTQRSPNRPNTTKPKTVCDTCYEKQHQTKEFKYRLTVIKGYGGACYCCGETNSKYLELDHINNDGYEHRKNIGSGNNIFRWAIKNSYPNTLQLLCANCHRAKSYYGGCDPH